MVSQQDIKHKINMNMFGQAFDAIDSRLKNENDKEEIDFLLDERLELQSVQKDYLKANKVLVKEHNIYKNFTEKIKHYEELLNLVNEKKEYYLQKDKEAKKTLPKNKMVTPYFTDIVKKYNTLFVMKRIIDSKKKEKLILETNEKSSKDELYQFINFAQDTESRLQRHIIEKEVERLRIYNLIHNYDEFD